MRSAAAAFHDFLIKENIVVSAHVLQHTSFTFT
jgi:hypothetical protein